KRAHSLLERGMIGEKRNASRASGHDEEGLEPGAHAQVILRNPRDAVCKLLQCAHELLWCTREKRRPSVGGRFTVARKGECEHHGPRPQDGADGPEEKP